MENLYTINEINHCFFIESQGAPVTEIEAHNGTCIVYSVSPPSSPSGEITGYRVSAVILFYNFIN